jgi:hypothetical protein
MVWADQSFDSEQVGDAMMKGRGQQRTVVPDIKTADGGARLYQSSGLPVDRSACRKVKQQQVYMYPLCIYWSKHRVARGRSTRWHDGLQQICTDRSRRGHGSCAWRVWMLPAAWHWWSREHAMWPKSYTAPESECRVRARRPPPSSTSYYLHL